ncbi:hypothetical protein DENSPDRAFT_880271 [Dentipellis sp. KUC8613]|nr:hypothetical protein DENSPDRAFT_880271 [Dentipellis sp. KUC8613]
MSSRGPIILWRTRQENTTDDAGVTILKSTLPPPALFDPGPYELSRRVERGQADLNTSLRYVPSLAYFCLKTLLPYPEDIHHFGPPRLRYEPPSLPFTYDILRALIPSYCPWPDHCEEEGLRLSEVDPRLWASIVQVFTELPDEFRVYSLALSDKHLPLLELIPQRTDFSLLTVLELPGCPDLTDDTIFELKALHGLSAFDATATQLTAQGLLRLSRTMTWAEGETNASKRRGPWQLRILRLRNCRLIGNRVFDALATFPLLSVIDLRGTNCSRNASRFPPFFRSSTDQDLFHPTSLLESLSHLASSPTLFSSDNYYAIHIPRRDYGASAQGRTSITSYPVSTRPIPTVAPEDSYVVLPPSSGVTSSIAPASADSFVPSKRTKLVTGNAEVLAIEKAKQEEEHRHALNTMAYIERQERLGESPPRDYDGRPIPRSECPRDSHSDCDHTTDADSDHGPFMDRWFDLADHPYGDSDSDHLMGDFPYCSNLTDSESESGIGSGGTSRLTPPPAGVSSDLLAEASTSRLPQAQNEPSALPRIEPSSRGPSATRPPEQPQSVQRVQPSNNVMEGSSRMATMKSAIAQQPNVSTSRPQRRHAGPSGVMRRSRPAARPNSVVTVPRRVAARPANIASQARAESSGSNSRPRDATGPQTRAPSGITSTTLPRTLNTPAHHSGPVDPPRQPGVMHNTAAPIASSSNPGAQSDQSSARGIQSAATVAPAIRTPNYMDMVAAEETQETSSRHRAEAFYAERREALTREVARPTLKRSRPSRTAETELPRRHLQLDEDVGRPRGEDILKLYRDPPPWSVMQMPPPSMRPPDETKQKADQLIAVKRSDERTRKNVADAKAMLAKRSRTASWQADGFQAPPTTPSAAKPTGPKNPFLAQRFANASTAPRPDMPKTRDSASASVEAKGKSALPPPGELKSLRPISAIPAPLLPEEIKKKIRGPKKSLPPTKGVKMPRPDKDLSTSRKLSLPDLHTSSSNRLQPSTMNDGKVGLRPADPAALRKRNATMPGPVKKAKTSASISDTPSTTKKMKSDPDGHVSTRKGGKGGFDWGTWTSKS